jgi:hypothetical protein
MSTAEDPLSLSCLPSSLSLLSLDSYLGRHEPLQDKIQPQNTCEEVRLRRRLLVMAREGLWRVS